MTVFERDDEIAWLAAAAAAAARGDGAVVLVEGAAGIGKTALLQEARAQALGKGMTVLAAVASALDRDFPFGLVHQLLDPLVAAAEPERRTRLLAGAAAQAEPVLRPQGEGAPPDAQPAHTVLHGLYWLIANLAEEGPLALLVDDLHWADASSLRLLEFVGRRLHGLPVLVVGATRTGEPGADLELLSALGGGPAARVLRPAPLSAAAAARLLAASFGDDPEQPFVDASLAATGGNPLLLRELGRAAAEAGISGRAGEVDQLDAIGSADLVAAVGRRLAALGPDAVAVAHAAAVLGGRATREDLAALARLEPAATTAAADRLARAAVLEPGGWTFVHPLVREAAQAGIAPGARADLHGRAAARLAVRGARVEEVAAHLLASEPAADPETVATLRAAAAAAAAEGAPATAVAHLRRALREPPADAERGPLLLELGELEVLVGDGEGPARLAQAIDGGGLADDEVARARAARARVLVFTEPRAALQELETAVALARDPRLRLQLEASLLDATAYDATLRDRREALLSAPGEPSPVRLAHLLMESAYRCAPIEETERLAQRVVTARALLDAPGTIGGTYHLAVLALRHAELRDLSDAVLAEGEREARRTGSRLGLGLVEHARAFWHLTFGSLTAGEGSARAGLEAMQELSLGLSIASMETVLSEFLRERGELEEASARLEAVRLPAGAERTIVYPDFLSARAMTRWARGGREAAEADLREARRALLAGGWRAPLKSMASLRLIGLLAERGEREEALALADEEEAVVARIGTPGALGLIRHARARALGGEEGIVMLGEAVELLEQSPLLLQTAWAQHDLGAALRRARRRAEAREPLRAALDLGRRIGATRLADSARDELLASGARPRREALSGVEALTPSERRVAELAAQGMTNREIAETLWVTRKTVELHLGHAYAKLGIRSRRELAGALGDGAGTGEGGPAEGEPVAAG
jgi:DNA-binding CsgD family transcriptional regulator